MAWAALVIGVSAALIGVELAAPCPPGGPLSFGRCATLRPTAVAVLGIAAVLYVVGLSAVLAWVRRLQRRRVADGRSARDWYLLAATIGLPVALLLAFTIVSALR